MDMSQAKLASFRRTTRRRLYIATTVAVAVVVALYALTLFGLNTLSGMRAFVEGEGLWTKHQRDAVQSLTAYVHTGDVSQYASFQKHLEVLHGVERSRLELNKPAPNLTVVHEGFLQLGLDARDMDNMVNLYRRFGSFEHVERAVDHWAAADAELAGLRTLGEEIRQRVGDKALDEDTQRTELRLIETSNARLNLAERKFSASLGDAAHWALSVLTWVMLTFTVAAAGILAGLFVAVNRLLSQNEAIAAGLAEQAWVRDGVAALHESTKGAPSEAKLCTDAIRAICEHLGASVGALYVMDGGDVLKRGGGYAVDDRDTGTDRFSLGQGVVGQVAADDELRIINELPDEHLRVRSGLGSSSPRWLALVPTRFEDQVNGVVELGLSGDLTTQARDYLEQASRVVGVTVATARSRAKLHELLEHTQQQAEELQAQQEELRQANEELEERSHALERAAAKLEEQQAELEAVNAELEERTEAQQREARELERARDELERKAIDLEEMSRYKSEFLANMSHELRTPLNSILLLSRLLAENKQGRLSDKEVQYAQTVHDSGGELIILIDEILDQARIEAGQLKLHVERVDLRDLLTSVEHQIRPSAEDKGLLFETSIARDVPKAIGTDDKRLRQILKNLLSNAVKFTAAGHVRVSVRRASRAELPAALKGTDNDYLAIAVEDTGIGIPPDKQALVFEAFKQADGATDRRYGGTGLGLAISQKLAALLGGTLVLRSEVDRGSTFTAFVPTSASGERIQSSSRPAGAPSHPVEVVIRNADEARVSEQPRPSSGLSRNAREARGSSKAPTPLTDDRATLSPGARTVLIVEDDLGFAGVLMDLAHEREFKALHATTGEQALALAHAHRPQAILLDIGLPDTDGISVISRLKDDLDLRHIPVHVISSHERNLDALRLGAAGYLRKPVNMEQISSAFGRIEARLARPVSKLLLAVPSEEEGAAIAKEIGGDDVDITRVSSGTDALAAIRRGGFDCAVIDWDLSEVSGKDVLLGIRESAGVSHVPVIVLSDEGLANPDHLTIDRYADRHIFKGGAARARLLDETTLFLHRVEERLPPEQRRVMRMLHDREALFTGRRLLVVDDDMRNVFALSAILEAQGFELTVARNGVEALEKLAGGAQPDLILMDIMMPEMDGYEAMRRIRVQEAFAKTPIIALTAKAMKGDRALCIAAGASDYLTKPVDDQKLLSLLRVWLYR